MKQKLLEDIDRLSIKNNQETKNKSFIKRILDENNDDLLMVDASCDLSSEKYYLNHKIGVLPLNTKTEKGYYTSLRDEKEFNRLYKVNFFNIRKKMFSISPGVDELKKHILRYIKTCIKNGKKPKSLHIQQADAGKAPGYNQNLAIIQREYLNPNSDFHNEVIKIVGTQKFPLRIYNTSQFFTGQGVIALHTLDLFDNEESKFRNLRQELNNFIPNVKTYIIPKDVSFLRSRSREKGDRSISYFQAFFSKLLGITPIVLYQNGKSKKAEISRNQKKGMAKLLKIINNDLNNSEILSKHLCISYSGDVQKFKKEFQEELNQISFLTSRLKMHMHLSIAGVGAATNVGPDSIFISYSSKYNK